MRVFIAIKLTPEIETRLSGIQNKLKTSGAGVKWVEPQNIHLTLKFLGERDDKKIEAIKAVLNETAARWKEYDLEPSSIGAFPSISRPSVIWAGIAKGREETTRLAADIEEGIAKTGIPKEKRPFACHITLGRVKTPGNTQRLAEVLRSLGEDLPQGQVMLRVERITLFKSTLTAKGPVYEALHEAHLKKS